MEEKNLVRDLCGGRQLESSGGRRESQAQKLKGTASQILVLSTDMGSGFLLQRRAVEREVPNAAA